MTFLLVLVLAFVAAYAIYIASLCARRRISPADFVDGGLQLPAWGYIFAGTGVVLAALCLYDHFRLISLYGYQYNHVAVGLILVSLCATLFQKRLWIAARLSGVRTAGGLLGDYYGSATLRIFFLVLLCLFSLPFAAYSLALCGELLSEATNGDLSRSLAIWGLGFFLFLFSAIGGWRGVIFVVAGQTLLVLTLMLFVGGFSAISLDGLSAFTHGLTTSSGIFAGQIPGVIQFSKGIGKDTDIGGIWTTVSILSFGLSIAGIALSPGFSFLGITTAARKGFAFGQVWMTAGLAIGLLLVVGPVIAFQLTSGADAGPIYAGFIARLSSFDQLIAVSFVLLLAASLLVSVAFFAASGASIVTLELTIRFLIPDLSPRQQQLAARIALALIYMAVSALASFTPVLSAVLGSLALGLSVQLLPAFVGFCWIPWISRSGVLTGCIIGFLMVFFTEPAGLLFFEGLFIDLPWGRWPLTVHAAAWGLSFNLAACFLVSLFTKAGDERAHRDKLHQAFRRDHMINFGVGAVRNAKWSLCLAWAFLALGPGAILGNTFFSQPFFTSATLNIGVPSLWVWQITFWLLGVPLVWWLAYPTRMSIIDTDIPSSAPSAVAFNPLNRARSPRWIGLLLARVGKR